MRVIGHMVTRNEHGRWLTDTLPWLLEICAGHVAVYDDQSTDETVAYAESRGAAVARREDIVPSFANHEGVFRWAGWRFLEQSQTPRPGDWILAVDADELLLSKTAGGDLLVVIHQLHEAIATAEHDRQTSIAFNVAEVFSFDSMGWPLVRFDGYWGTINACRLAKWQPGGTFDARREGGGSLPSGWAHNARLATALEIFHLGYAREEDRYAKRERYSEGTGHNPRHVASILTQATLRHWVGMRPPLT